MAEVLRRLGLEDCFDDVVCFESLNVKKEIADTDTPKTSVIGDNDVKPAGILPKSPIICKPFENAFQEAFKIAKINPDKTVIYFG